MNQLKTIWKYVLFAHIQCITPPRQQMIKRPLKLAVSVLEWLWVGYIQVSDSCIPLNINFIEVIVSIIQLSVCMIGLHKYSQLSQVIGIIICYRTVISQ